MLISAQILSIPPYLSTSWKNITSLHAVPDKDHFTFIVILNNGMQVSIPNLEKTAVDSIFEAHARYGCAQGVQPARENSLSFPTSGNIDLMTSAMQHNPEQADSPEIPKEILEKITSIAKVLGLEDAQELPKAEPHCNCPFCQIARAFHGSETAAKTEEIVSDNELQFRSWDIKQSAEKLYTVINPCDEKEQYSVYLGDPIGCTCGQKNCEHIRAVLNS
jgi:hypothetical protein